MEFERFLLYTGRITAVELKEVLEEQFRRCFYGLKYNAERFFSGYMDENGDLASYRQIPFGDVLENMPLFENVKKRNGSDMKSLISEWKDWNRRLMEPVASYSTQSKYGKSLYERQVEKKLVAKYIVQSGMVAPCGEKIVLPEGSSAFYVGMALAAHSSGSQLVTSNGPFIREYRDNPSIAKSFNSVTTVGGEIDYDHNKELSDHGGVYGMECQRIYGEAIKQDPGATIVVMPVTGILPGLGPYSADGASQGEKKSILEQSFAADVRLVIFVADFTKHREDAVRDYGVPIFRQRSWERLVQDNTDRIKLVTCPPPKLRLALANSKSYIEPRDRDYKELPNISYDELTREDAVYLRVTKEFDEMLRRDRGEPMFHEVLSASSSPSNAVTTTSES